LQANLRAVGPDVKIIVDGRGVIRCGCELHSQDDSAQVIENPVVVFEVLSESTSRTDRIEKVREYRQRAHHAYIILEQDSIGARRLNGGTTPGCFHVDDGDRLLMPEIGIEIPLADLYAGIRRLGSRCRRLKPGLPIGRHKANAA